MSGSVMKPSRSSRNPIRGWKPASHALVLFMATCSMVMQFGCGTVPTDTESVDSAAVLQARRWPPEPAVARILWQGEIRGPISFEKPPGWFKRVLQWVTGREPFEMVRAHGVAMDDVDRLWVTDPGAQRIYIFDINNGRHKVLPLKGDPPVLSPIALTHDTQGVAYVSDSREGTIRRFDAEGHSLEPWGGEDALVRPTGLVFDRQNSLLWVVDTGGHRILAFDTQGQVVRSLGERGNAAGQFNFPTHLTIDDQGRLLVTDTANFRVQILAQDGTPLATMGRAGNGPGSMAKAKGVATDTEGHIYVVDALFANVQIFDDEGRLLLYFGEHGSGVGEFWLPAGIYISRDDRIYVVDAFNQRIQIFQYVRE